MFPNQGQEHALRIWERLGARESCQIITRFEVAACRGRATRQMRDSTCFVPPTWNRSN